MQGSKKIKVVRKNIGNPRMLTTKTTTTVQLLLLLFTTNVVLIVTVYLAKVVRRSKKCQIIISTAFLVEIRKKSGIVHANALLRPSSLQIDSKMPGLKLARRLSKNKRCLKWLRAAAYF